MSKHTILETPLGHLEAEMNTNSLLLHFTYTGKKFSRGLYMEMLDTFEDVVEGLRAKGISEVFSFVDKAEAMSSKWQSMFGLTPFLEFEDKMLYRRAL